jgi:hypothetical protein
MDLGLPAVLRILREVPRLSIKLLRPLHRIRKASGMARRCLSTSVGHCDRRPALLRLYTPACKALSTGEEVGSIRYPLRHLSASGTHSSRPHSLSIQWHAFWGSFHVLGSRARGMFRLLRCSHEVTSIAQEQYRESALWFAVLLNFKHIFVYIAIPVGVYLLRSFCFHKGSPACAS